MLDDDIQYLGTRIVTPGRPPEQRKLTGLAFNVERCGNEDGYRMIFRRANCPVIHIGRLPPPIGNVAEKRRRDCEDGKASFRCPVVSRTHAKLVLHESFALLTDMRSHHGTHVRKSYETQSRKIPPNIPTRITDGDVITFGKVVGKNEDLVRPVVAKVEFIYTTATRPSLDVNVPVIPPLFPSPPKHNLSGRYGLDLSSDFSDSSSPKMSPVSDVDPHRDLSHDACGGFGQAMSQTSSFFSLRLPPLSPVEAPAPTRSLLSSWTRFPKSFSAAPEPPAAGKSQPLTSPSAQKSSPQPAQDRDSMSLSSRSSSPSGDVVEPPSSSPKLPVVGAWPHSRPHSPMPASSGADTWKAEIAALNGNVSALQKEVREHNDLNNEHRDKLQARVVDIEERFEDLHATCKDVSDRIGVVESFDIEGVHGRVDDFDTSLKALTVKVDGKEQDKKDVEAEIEDRVQVALGELMAAKAKALAEVEDAKFGAVAAVGVSASEATSPLKRKRDEMDEEFQMDIHSPVAPVEVIEVPARKRSRGSGGRIVFQTLTAVTVGAVAAWSALAFA